MKNIITVKDEIKHVRALLDHTDRWYVFQYAPEVDELKELAEKAREYAQEKLRKISTGNLYQRYLIWEKSDPIETGKGHYHSFLDDVVWNMGLESLRGTERNMFEENCVLEVKWL